MSKGAGRSRAGAHQEEHRPCRTLTEYDADIFAEGLRRGGAVVSARVPDADFSRLQAIMDRSAVNVSERAAAYRQTGWQSFNANGSITADQALKERELYMRR